MWKAVNSYIYNTSLMRLVVIWPMPWPHCFGPIFGWCWIFSFWQDDWISQLLCVLDKLGYLDLFQFGFRQSSEDSPGCLVRLLSLMTEQSEFSFPHNRLQYFPGVVGWVGIWKHCFEVVLHLPGWSGSWDGAVECHSGQKNLSCLLCYKVFLGIYSFNSPLISTFKCHI